ncbi:MAG TPA: hypothetical protein VJ486_06980 [Geothrix sp.]|nr:hypothetical protein [Geothrix sp.]
MAEESIESLKAELEALKPPPGCYWFDPMMARGIRDAVNLAMLDEGREDIRIYAELDPVAASMGWTCLRIEAGRWRFVVLIYGWRPSLKIKDALWLLSEMAKAKAAADDLSDLAVELENARFARSLLTDGRQLAARNLRKATKAVELSCLNLSATAESPRNWSNLIPEDALVDGLFYAVVEDQDEA